MQEEEKGADGGGGGGGAKYRDIVIAVHGIGEQSRNSTVRSVVGMAAPLAGGKGQDRMTFHYPLGYFHSDLEDAAKVSPFDAAMGVNESLKDVGFSEIFWADIPEDVVKERRTLEETKQWARSVVARARNLYEQKKGAIPPSPPGVFNFAKAAPPNFNRAADALEEVVDTIYVMENLSWILEKAGMMTFDIREVLEDYLGDVQIVTEFTRFRNQILGRFHAEIAKIHEIDKGADIHIVAHSEGTVIAFMGLLHAMSGTTFVPCTGGWKEERGTASPEWLKKVKGFMTLGSPIDKHLLLWPALWKGFDFQGFRGRMKNEGFTEGQIHWQNYYDLADPIGFDLDTARLWLKEQGNRLFSFKKEDDIGFSRYLLPGKAHNDYWEDPQIFEHFVGKVLRPGASEPGAAAPATKKQAAVISSALPYVLSAILLITACYVFLRAAMNFYVPDLEVTERYIRYMMTGLPSRGDAYTGWKVVGDCLAWSGVLGGASIAARLPSLSGQKKLVSFLALVVSWICAFCVSHEVLKLLIGERLRRILQHGNVLEIEKSSYYFLGIAICAGVTLVVLVCRFLGRSRSPVDLGRETSLKWYRKGPRPVIVFGAILTAVIGLAPVATQGNKQINEEQVEIFSRMKRDAHKAELVEKSDDKAASDRADAGPFAPLPKPAEEQKKELEVDAEKKAKKDIANAKDVLNRTPPIWPLIVAWLIFIYLWWLSILIFDLAFVWNSYVRKGKAIQCLRDWRKSG